MHPHIPWQANKDTLRDLAQIILEKLQFLTFTVFCRISESSVKKDVLRILREAQASAGLDRLAPLLHSVSLPELSL